MAHATGTPVLSTSIDVAAVLQELVEARRRLRQVIDNLPALVGYWDRELRNRVANRAYVEWFGKSPAEMDGLHLSEVLGEQLFRQNLPFAKAALAGQPQHFDRTIVDALGVLRYSRASYIPDVDDQGNVAGFFVLVIDVTERVMAERALTDEQARTSRLAAQLRIVSRVSTSLHDLDARTVQEAVADAVIELGYSGSNLAVVDDAAGMFTPSHGRGIFASFDGMRLPVTVGSTHAALSRGEMVVVDDYQEFPAAVPTIRATGVRTAIAIPVRASGRVVAVLHVGRTTIQPVEDADREVLSLLADITGTALTNAATHAVVRESSRHFAKVAETDALTGLGNRLLADAMLANVRDGDVLVLIDLDAFKAVNDLHGHAGGDETLRSFATLLRRELRAVDQVARVGGEEFLVILPDTSLAVGDSILARLRGCWAASMPLTTFSAGLARLRSGEAAEHGYGRADAALYAAKRGGRDRHVLAE